MTINEVITTGNVTFAIGIIGILFSIYKSYKNPQIESDKSMISLADRVGNVEKTVGEIKETHLKTVEQDIKSLTISVNELSKTVVRLATIIDERIPKGNPTLTPN